MSMQIRVLFFGVLKDLAGRSSESLKISDDATAGSVLEHYERQFSSLKGALSSVAISINQQYAHRQDRLRPGDEVALLPPVSGGAPSDSPLVKLIRERIVPHDIVPGLERPEDGAIVIFDGVVRNH